MLISLIEIAVLVLLLNLSRMQEIVAATGLALYLFRGRHRDKVDIRLKGSHSAEHARRAPRYWLFPHEDV